MKAASTAMKMSQETRGRTPELNQRAAAEVESFGHTLRDKAGIDDVVQPITRAQGVFEFLSDTSAGPSDPMSDPMSVKTAFRLLTAYLATRSRDGPRCGVCRDEGRHMSILQGVLLHPTPCRTGSEG